MTAESRTRFTRTCPRCGGRRGAEDFYPGGYSVCRACCLAGWAAASGANGERRAPRVRRTLVPVNILRLVDRMWPVLNRVMGAHVAVYRATGGRIGHRFPGVPTMLLLEHVGARTRKRRTAALLYIEDGPNLVLIASKAGNPRHPAWFHNLMAHPEVEVQVRSERRQVRAREATPEERERLWPRAVRAWPGYRTYQRRTGRRIPLVILEPRAG